MKVSPDALRGARLAKGLTQGQLAASAGVSLSLISMIERGERGVPILTLIRIAAALGMEPEGLLPGRGRGSTADQEA